MTWVAGSTCRPCRASVRTPRTSPCWWCLPPPGPSYIREHPVRVPGGTFHAGIARPLDAPDGWWLTVAWVTRRRGRRQLSGHRHRSRDHRRIHRWAARPGGRRGALRHDPRGRRQAPDAARPDRPARRSGTAVARPARAPARLPVRARTCDGDAAHALAEAVLAGFVRAVEEAAPGPDRTRSSTSPLSPFATYSTISWMNYGDAKRRRAARIPGPPRKPDREPDETGTTPTKTPTPRL